ncbi:MAG TPA: tRNA pseudouridine(55) synthase TruB [Candidatus Rothia avicola]|uniref:tRNA pseudouridine synthase B n=1 Tax=Candidatus Rothia avicola TaxID=2840478 RepID=A0A9D1ZPL5_9MICC|nr:tRNA pseudouridine(55) synthase TruB [Candidatus Rothia avicola]
MAKKAPTGPSGLIVVDKPAGLTSHDVVSKMRWIAGTRKVGHAGTLDPMATGVLILGINKATRLLTWVVGETKTYTATIRLGVSTLTDDADGEATAVSHNGALDSISEDAIRQHIADLTGDIMQVPSAVSAIKVNGVRSYARVRSGEEVDLEARPITVHSFDLHDARPATGTYQLGEEEVSASVLDLDVTVVCSAGTYIRALARDLGTALGTGAHLTALRRTAIGEIRAEDAHTLDELIAGREAEQVAPLLPIEEAARRLFAVRNLTAAEATDLANGRRIAPTDGSPATTAPKTGSTGGHDKPTTTGLTAAFAPNGTLVAIIENTRFRRENVAAPVLVFEAGTTFKEN